MEATEIIQLIKDAKKKTPVRVFLKEKKEIRFENCRVFGVGDKIVFGDWCDIGKALEAQSADVEDLVIESDCRNSAIALLDTKDLKARVEPGAIIREGAEIGDGAVVMMGAVINIGAVVGAGTMIDMGAILGGRATVGRNCHIGAGAVLAGVIEPPSAKPVVVEDGVLIGANAVVLEGVRVGRGAVVAAGAVVIEDVPPETVAAGVPARTVKSVRDTDEAKIALVQALREL
ncbi:MAG: 2,3,4,5-tetrahydropyridine-2,6-dicarboxylate N-acetyltransferase [Clostridiales Family XIII bacterium]|jgi:2,3,4,5-tetrahydropyridine-2-carboxylate N-succinyltransferase/tetrahydrodipicolinate N-acetyltransferase|nr:2,3,4,5-tetrahydropyridine-2,6-dicarboxylate N-acetyltransferase [Clostridiales Family XIII bacterium]